MLHQDFRMGPLWTKKAAFGIAGFLGAALCESPRREKPCKRFRCRCRTLRIAASVEVTSERCLLRPRLCAPGRVRSWRVDCLRFARKFVVSSLGDFVCPLRRFPCWLYEWGGGRFVGCQVGAQVSCAPTRNWSEGR